MVKKVCFVCNGNNSRSIMAEYIARHVWKDKIEVCSCGINANPTKYVCLNTQIVLCELGIDISRRKRCIISNDFLGNEYYYYLALDDTVRRYLISEYGIWREQVSVLGSEICDPRGCGIEIYRKCRNEIEKAIKELDLNKMLLD